MSHLFYATKFYGGADHMNVLEDLECENKCIYLGPWTKLRKRSQRSHSLGDFVTALKSFV